MSTKRMIQPRKENMTHKQRLNSDEQTGNTGPLPQKAFDALLPWTKNVVLAHHKQSQQTDARIATL